MTDEIMRLVLDLASSSKDVGELVGKLGELKSKGAEVAETYHVMAKAGEGYTVATREENKAMDEAVRKAVELTQAQRALNIVIDESIAEQKALATATVTTGKHADQAKDKQGGFGRSILATSYAFQDFTSQLGDRGLAGAIGAVQNNIPSVLAGLGVGAGVAGAVSAISVGLGLLLPQMGKLADAFSTGATKTEADRMKELADNTHRTAEETDKLNKYKREQASLEKIRDGQENAAHKEKQSIEEFFGAEVDFDANGKPIKADTQGSLAKALGATGRGAQMTEAERANLKVIDEDLLLANNDHNRALNRKRRREVESEIQTRINAANVEKAGGLLGRASTDKGARDTIRSLAKQSPGNFRRNFESDLAGMEPEALKAVDAEDEATEGVHEDWRLGKERRKGAAAAKAKAAKRKHDADKSNAADMDEADDMRNRKGKRDAEEDKKHDAKVLHDQKEQAERRAKLDDKIEKGLGKGFMAEAEMRILELDPNDRRGRAGLSQFITQQAQKKLTHEGFSPMAAMGGAQRAEGMIRNDIGSQLDQRGQGRGDQGKQELYQLLKQILATASQNIGLSKAQMADLKAQQRENTSNLNNTRTNASGGAQ
jgi:hypothetical protein